MKEIKRRLQFYIRTSINDVKWRLKGLGRSESCHEQTQQYVPADSPEFTALEKEFERESEEHEMKKPTLDPRRTMAFLSLSKEHCCNFITAPYFRRRIITALAWANAHGFTAFLADYSTPYGLLALETMLQMKKDGKNITVYSARTRWIKNRKTYRLIKETPIEIAILSSSADYYYTALPAETILTVIFESGALCSEAGLWISKRKIPKHIIKAWNMPSETEDACE